MTVITMLGKIKLTGTKDKRILKNIEGTESIKEIVEKNLLQTMAKL